MEVEPDTGLITGLRVDPGGRAQHSDAAVGINRLADEPDLIQVRAIRPTAPVSCGPAAAGGHTTMIKPRPLRPAVDGGSPSTTSPSTRRRRR